jgi:hypothetical protein
VANEIVVWLLREELDAELLRLIVGRCVYVGDLPRRARTEMPTPEQECAFCKQVNVR